MKKTVKAVGKVFAVTLALMIIVSSLTTAFATEGTYGSRGSDPKGILWKKGFSISYNDAQGTRHTFSPSAGLPMKVHYFAVQNEVVDFSNDGQRAFCIEPDRDSELVSQGNTYYYNGTTSSVGLNAYDKQLSAAQKVMLNIVLANG